MSQLFTIFSETIIKVGKDEVLKDNTQKIIEDDISTEDSEEKFYSEGDAMEMLTEMTIYLYNVQMRTFSNILYVIRSQTPIVV